MDSVILAWIGAAAPLDTTRMATAVTPSPTAPSASLEHDWTDNRQIRWYRSPIPMAQLRALSERRNLRPLLHVLGFIAMLAATGAVVMLVHRHLSWPWLIPALFVHATVFRTLQHSRHELSHRTVFRSRFLNELFLRLFSFLQWSSPDHFRASHVRHHQYTVHGELDREVQLPRPFQPLQWLFRFVAAVPNCVAEIKVLVRELPHRAPHVFSVPFYNLHRLRAAIESDLPPAPRGLLRAWAQMLPILWHQRREPGCVTVPPLPARSA